MIMTTCSGLAPNYRAGDASWYGVKSRGAGREQHGGDDTYRQHIDANGRGRGRGMDTHKVWWP